jgi:hypothetical protein
MIGLLLMLAVLGVAAWALVTFVPMPQGIKTLIIIVAVLGGILFALRAFGIGFPSLDMRVPAIK